MACLEQPLVPSIPAVQSIGSGMNGAQGGWRRGWCKSASRRARVCYR